MLLIRPFSRVEHIGNGENWQREKAVPFSASRLLTPSRHSISHEIKKNSECGFARVREKESNEKSRKFWTSARHRSSSKPEKIGSKLFNYWRSNTMNSLCCVECFAPKTESSSIQRFQWCHTIKAWLVDAKTTLNVFLLWSLKAEKKTFRGLDERCHVTFRFKF